MRLRMAAVVAALAITAAACTSTASPGPTASGGGTATSCAKTHYVPYIFHVPPSIPFISLFKKGVDQAAKDFAGPPYCIRTEFLAPDKFDTAQMAQILDAALAKNPDALAIAYPDVSALTPGIQRALDKGLPVVSVNAGGDEALKLGVLTHVGQDESLASRLQGEIFAKNGAKKVMCVNDNPGTNVLTLRCNGIKAGMEAAGGTSFEFPASNADPIEMKAALIAGLTANPDVDAIGGVYAGDYQIALQAIEAVGKTGQIKVGIFDMEPGTLALDDVKAGKLLFASSQGPFLQGYVPIQLLAMQLAFGQMPGIGGLTNTGGLIVTKDNVDFYLNRTNTLGF